jgi:hypothetical protein
MAPLLSVRLAGVTVTLVGGGGGFITALPLLPLHAVKSGSKAVDRMRNFVRRIWTLVLGGTFYVSTTAAR